MVKPRLYSEDNTTKAAALWTLKKVLITSLKLLHPYMPFVTEEIYGMLPIKDNAESRALSLKCLKKISEECNVKITIIYGDNAPRCLAKEAVEKNPLHIFIGEDSGFLKEFRRLYHCSPISMVTSGVVCTIPAEYQSTQKIS